MTRSATGTIRHAMILALALSGMVAVAGCGSGVRTNDSAEVPLTTAPGAVAATTEATAGTTTTTSAPTTTDAPTSSTTGAGAGGIPEADRPGNLGDDPVLDSLADDCFGGDFAACDQLFFQSDADSSYEAYGDSCGGRNEPAGLCTGIYGPH